MTPQRFTDINAMRTWVRDRQSAGERIGLVPTMGALHEGHLSLARAAREQCDRVVASVFVNPTQFGPGEDLQRYPRDLERDSELLAEIGVEAVFAPSVDTMYPAGAETSIDVGSVAKPLEGTSRPTHFAGVATVVAKLFAIAPADRAYFGQKDYQQTVVIRRLVLDLNLPIEVIICPTVREPDGLAMSSRNAYLSAEERVRALSLSRGLEAARLAYDAGERDAAAVRAAAEAEIAPIEGVRLEYVAVLRDGTMQQPETIDGPAVVAVAARVGQTRLIDNARLE